MAAIKRGFLHLMIDNKMICIILMVATVATIPSWMSKGEKRKDFFHDCVTLWAGCVGGILAVLSCALWQFCPHVLARGTRNLRPTSRSRLCFVAAFYVVRADLVCAQCDLIYMYRVGLGLSSKIGCPFSCMPFTVCPYMKSLTLLC